MNAFTRPVLSMRLVAPVVVCALLSMGGARACPAPARATYEAGTPAFQDPLGAGFRVRGQVAPGVAFELVFSIRPEEPMPGARVTLLLPEEVEIAGGSTEWQGAVAAHETVELRATLSLQQNRPCDVRALVEDVGGTSPDRVYCASLDPGLPEGLRWRPRGRGQVHYRQVQRSSEQQATLPAPGIAQAAPYTFGNTTVYGRIEYFDDGYSVHPVRQAWAELWQLTDSGDLVFLASGISGESGDFWFSLDLPGDMYVVGVIFCETPASVVTNPDGEEYGVIVGPEKIIAGSPNDLQSWRIRPEYDEWEASDYALTAYEWTAANGKLWARPPVVITYPCACSPYTDYQGIHLPAQSQLAWGRDTMLHEYAHAIFYAAYGGSFPTCAYSGSHGLTTETCEQIALADGFARFFVNAVNNSKYLPVGSFCGAAFIDIEDNNLELGDDCIANNSGAIVEGAVASVFWDIFDDANGDPDHPWLGDTDRDYLSMGFNEILETICAYRPQGINQFWDGWFDRYGPDGGLNLIYYDHGIDKNTAPVLGSPSPADAAAVLPGPITLAWVGSDAEGDALRYDVYFGTTSDPPLVASNRTLATYTPISPLNPGTYYWRVVARDPLGKQTMGPVWRFSVCASGISLRAGWNLISAYWAPAGTDPGVALAQAAGQYSVVHAYDPSRTADPWMQYIPGGGSGNDLVEVNPGMGLWVHATAPVAVCITDTAVVSSSIPLRPGWNLVGYPSLTPRPVAEALASIGGKYDLVYAYDPTNIGDPWKRYNPAMPAVLNDLREMAPGKGYWVHVTEDCTWAAQ